MSHDGEFLVDKEPEMCVKIEMFLSPVEAVVRGDYFVYGRFLKSQLIGGERSEG